MGITLTIGTKSQGLEPIKKAALDFYRSCESKVKELAAKIEGFVNHYFATFFLVAGIACSLYFAPEITVVGAAITFLIRKKTEKSHAKENQITTILNATFSGIGGMGALLCRVWADQSGSYLPMTPIFGGIALGNTLHRLHCHFYPKG